MTKIVSFIGLGLTLVPAFLVYQGTLSLDTSKNLMLIGTIAWFATAPYWMNKPSKSTATDE